MFRHKCANSTSFPGGAGCVEEGFGKCCLSDFLETFLFSGSQLVWVWVEPRRPSAWFHYSVEPGSKQGRLYGLKPFWIFKSFVISCLEASNVLKL